MDTEIDIDSFTEYGKPLHITVNIRFYQDETNDSSRGSKLFWTYEIMKIKASFSGRDGGPVDYTDYLDSEHESEIKEVCDKELNNFTKAA